MVGNLVEWDNCLYLDLMCDGSQFQYQLTQACEVIYADISYDKVISRVD